MIITIGHTKGGVGKSTLALNIAVERLRSGVDILLIDGDARQTSVSKAASIRNDSGLSPTLPCVVLDDPRSFRHQINLLKEKYHDLIIDVGGKDTSTLRAALTVTDVLLLPVAPESVEIWALDDIFETITEARSIKDFRVRAILNRAKPAGRDNDDTISVLREYTDLDIIPGSIGNRGAFSSAFGRGLSVAEYRPINLKASQEIAGLVTALYT